MSKLIGGRFTVEREVSYYVVDTWTEHNQVAETDFASRAEAEEWARRYVAAAEQRGIRAATGYLPAPQKAKE